MWVRRYKKILVSLAVLVLLRSNFSLSCGSAADVDAAACCATNSSCHGESGVTNPQACCDQEAQSKSSLLLQSMAPLSSSIVQHDASSHAESWHLAAEIVISRQKEELRDTPLKFLNRDPVILHCTLLI